VPAEQPPPSRFLCGGTPTLLWVAVDPALRECIAVNGTIAIESRPMGGTHLRIPHEQQSSTRTTLSVVNVIRELATLEPRLSPSGA